MKKVENSNLDREAAESLRKNIDDFEVLNKTQEKIRDLT
jgi:predicted DNA binding CopG/RHH family protein